ncbi:MAG: tetratricopeptide repeat protein [Chloroflexia bacterium]|nr:tetratricopeptide repeat protein [Chloroflexia bacterium]
MIRPSSSLLDDLQTIRTERSEVDSRPGAPGDQAAGGSLAGAERAGEALDALFSAPKSEARPEPGSPWQVTAPDAEGNDDISFPIESMAFTIPLPGEDTLPEAARVIIETSTDDLTQGRMEAARDACYAALAYASTDHGIYLRLAEIAAARRSFRQAREHAFNLARIAEIAGETDVVRLAYRVLLHVSDDVVSVLGHVVDLDMVTGFTDEGADRATKLIRILAERGDVSGALEYADKLYALAPGDTAATLENTILLVQNGQTDEAIARWEESVDLGADVTVGKAALAAIVSRTSDADHWEMLADIAEAIRTGEAPTGTSTAYRRMAATLPTTPSLTAGGALLLAAERDDAALPILATVAADATAPPSIRCVAAVATTGLLGQQRQVIERTRALQVALTLLDQHPAPDDFPWSGLLGFTPTVADLAVDLSDALRDQGQRVKALDVLKAAQQRSKAHDRLVYAMADAYLQANQLGSALAALDGLAAAHKQAGHLDQMANVLRHMSQLAPHNIKVKTRLIDTFLQRGFVAEARTELLHRADLEERGGMIAEAMRSLERAAGLGWSLGLHDETYAIYGRVIAMNPEAAEPRHTLVALLLQGGRVADAASQQRAIVDLSMRTNKRHEAIAALHQVIGLTPDDTSAYYQLGNLLGSVGEYGQAERVFRRIVALAPDEVMAAARAEAMSALRERAAEG